MHGQPLFIPASHCYCEQKTSCHKALLETKTMTTAA